MTINARKLIAHTSKGVFIVAPGGMKARTFALSAAGLAKTMQRVATITRNQVANRIARKTRTHIIRHAESVIEAAKWGNKAFTVGISLSAFWEKPLGAVTQDLTKELARLAFPDVQSIVNQGYSKTHLLLGTPEEGGEAERLRKAKEIAADYLDVDETTTNLIRKYLADAEQNGMSNEEASDYMLGKVSAGASGRANTTGTTTAMEGWTKGSIGAMFESDVIEVSVIGCMSREEELWGKEYYAQYLFSADGRRPESSCNIRDVPIQYASELNFHPNHTGLVTPSRFRK